MDGVVFLNEVVLNDAAISGAVELTRHIHHQIYRHKHRDTTKDGTQWLVCWDKSHTFNQNDAFTAQS